MYLGMRVVQGVDMTTWLYSQDNTKCLPHDNAAAAQCKRAATYLLLISGSAIELIHKPSPMGIHPSITEGHHASTRHMLSPASARATDGAFQEKRPVSSARRGGGRPALRAAACRDVAAWLSGRIKSVVAACRRLQNDAMCLSGPFRTTQAACDASTQTHQQS